MPFINESMMQVGRPLAGWTGRFFHSENLTFAYWDIAPNAAQLHEHQHPQEETWNIVSGELALTIDGVEQITGPGEAVVVPPNAPHSARPLGACRAIVVDFPLRRELPGVVADPSCSFRIP